MAHDCYDGNATEDPKLKVRHAKFKVGPAKTRDGRDAYILEISDRLYGKFFSEKLDRVLGHDWDLLGHSSRHELTVSDLMPNNEPLSVEFEATMTPTHWNISDDSKESIRTNLEPFIGKRVLVKVTEVVE